MRWLLLDTNAWIHLANGTGPLPPAQRARVIAILTDRSARRRFDVFTSQPVEQELVLKAHEDPEAVFRAFDLMNLATHGRILLHTADRIRLEILQGGGQLNRGRRFVQGRNRAQRIAAFARRDIEQLRTYADEVVAYKAGNPLDRKENVPKALADLDRLSADWRTSWNAEAADDEVTGKFVMEQVEKYGRSNIVRPVDPRAFPTAYWSVRIWTARARRVLADGGSPRAPGTFDHHVAIDAASYADILVGRDEKFGRRIIDVVKPAFRNYTLPEFAEHALTDPP